MKYESKKEESCSRNTFFGEKINLVLSKITQIFSPRKGLGMAELAKVFLFSFFLNLSQLILPEFPRFPTRMSSCPLLHLSSVASSYRLFRASPCQAHCTVIYFLHFSFDIHDNNYQFLKIYILCLVLCWKHSVYIIHLILIMHPPFFFQKPERVEGLRIWCTLKTKKQNSRDWNLAIHHVEALSPIIKLCCLCALIFMDCPWGLCRLRRVQCVRHYRCSCLSRGGSTHCWMTITFPSFLIKQHQFARKWKPSASFPNYSHQCSLMTISLHALPLIELLFSSKVGEFFLGGEITVIIYNCRLVDFFSPWSPVMILSSSEWDHVWEKLFSPHSRCLLLSEANPGWACLPNPANESHAFFCYREGIGNKQEINKGHKPGQGEWFLEVSFPTVKEQLSCPKEVELTWYNPGTAICCQEKKKDS